MLLEGPNKRHDRKYAQRHRTNKQMNADLRYGLVETVFGIFVYITVGMCLLIVPPNASTMPTSRYRTEEEKQLKKCDKPISAQPFTDTHVQSAL